MYCLTRYEMKFGDLIVPARTKCRVINKLETDTVNAPGVQVSIMINNDVVGLEDQENENKVVEFQSNVNKAELIGLVVWTNTTAVYMDAGNKLYRHTGLYDWQLEKIFGGKEKMPNEFVGEKHRYNGKDVELQRVIDFLEDEFAEWVRDNCEMYVLTEEDIENGEGCSDADPGNMTLSDEGLSQFYKKQLEYQQKLESTGFTYEFQGGLIWE